jgi:translocation and assembly module TamA
MASIRFFFVSVFLMVFAVHANAQHAGVEVIGQNENFSPPDEIKGEILGSSSESEKMALVQNWLIQHGYLHAETDSITTTENRTKIFVDEGCLFRLEAMNVEVAGEGNDELSSALLNGMSPYGEVFTGELVQQVSAGWLAALEQEGYYLGEFRVEEIKKNSEACTINISATVSAGERLSVRGVRFEGVVRNNPDHLRRVSGIHIGEILTPGLLERGRRNLINSGLFDDVSPGELIFVNGDEPYVLYEVEEQQLNFFDGLIGYVPDAAGSGNIAGYGDILLRNSIADGNLLELRYEQLQPMVSKLDFRAEQHFIAGSPFRAGGRFNFTQQDSSYLVRDFELNSGYRLFTGFEVVGHVRAERSSVAEPGIGVTTPALNSRANFYGLGFNLRNTDRFRVPTRGYESRVMLERGRRFINDERFADDERRSYNQSILRADVRGYVPVGSRQVLAPRLNAKFLESPAYLVTDLFRFGGAESIRGFREDQFRASSVVWGEIEGRYLLDRHSFLFLFGAYGIYNRPQLINEATDVLAVTDNLTSFGFGLAFQSPVGIIKFSFAISPDEDLGNGKVHVGITAGL